MPISSENFLSQFSKAKSKLINENCTVNYKYNIDDDKFCLSAEKRKFKFRKKIEK